jgi:sulfur carrier protein
MEIVVNGAPVDVPEGLTLEELLVRLEIRRDHTAVALNREIARRAAYGTTVLREGDHLEIVHPMAGGR